jgi:hypothetical protein
MKPVRVIMMGTRLGVFRKNEGGDHVFDRAYQIKPGMSEEVFRGQIVSDLEFAGFRPDAKSIASFPWLKRK